MTKKQTFIDEIMKLLQDAPENFLSPDALDYWNGLNATEDKEKPAFTENGKIVLRGMQDNKTAYNNLFKSKDLGATLGLSSRTVSGAMRKLTTDGYVEKMGENPSIYSLTKKGDEATFDEA